MNKGTLVLCDEALGQLPLPKPLVYPDCQRLASGVDPMQFFQRPVNMLSCQRPQE